MKKNFTRTVRPLRVVTVHLNVRESSSSSSSTGCSFSLSVSYSFVSYFPLLLSVDGECLGLTGPILYESAKLQVKAFTKTTFYSFIFYSAKSSDMVSKGVQSFMRTFQANSNSFFRANKFTICWFLFGVIKNYYFHKSWQNFVSRGSHGSYEPKLTFDLAHVFGWSLRARL